MPELTAEIVRDIVKSEVQVIREEMTSGFVAVRQEMVDGFTQILDTMQNLHDENQEDIARLERVNGLRQ